MAKLKLRYLVVSLLLILTAIIVTALQHTSIYDEGVVSASLLKIPVRIGKWRGRDLTLDEKVYEILETRAIIHRNYTDDQGNAVLLSIVHYSDTKVDFHAPEACLGGRGEGTKKIVKKITINEDNKPLTLEVAEIVASGLNGSSLSYYFYKAGNFIGQNYIKMRLNIAANKLLRNDTRGSLIRISTSLTPGKEAAANTLLLGFMKDLLPYVQHSL